MLVYILQHLITAEVIDGLLIANHRKPIRMAGIGCCHQIMEQPYIRPVIPHGELFQNNLFLPLKLNRIKH